MATTDWQRLPFEEQIRYFGDKLNVPTDSYRDISGAEHDAAFVVAGAKGAVLNDLRKAVDRAIAEGTTLEQFRREFEDVVQRTGWAFRGGSAWRSQVIWDTNLRTSYAAGRYEQMQQVATTRPYWQWRHGGSAHPRPQHLALDGRVFAATDPFWQSFGTPPQGYGCRCSVFTLSDRDLERRGLTVDPGPQLGDRLPIPDLPGQTTAMNPPAGWGHIHGSSTPESRARLLDNVTRRLDPALAAQVRAEAARRQAARPTPPATPPAAPTWPTDPDGLTVIRQLGGSTGAELVEDPATGRQFVRKRGANPDHLREEFTADNAYRALGVAVPEARLYDTANGPVKLAEYIQGRTLADLNATERQAVYRELQKDFAADAILGNWDVIGLGRDNILVDASGKPWRIDNGGSLRYRAQGGQKGDAWNDYPTELWSLRDPRRNQNTFEAFGDLAHMDMVNQLEALGSRRADLINALPPELHDTMNRRLDEAVRVARISRTLEDDAFKPEYISQFTKHSLGLRAAGIVDKLPQRFDLGAGNQLYDENGKRFDHLREPGGLVQELADYMERNGGRYDLAREYGDEQGGDSWNDLPKALKHHLVINRTVPDDQYFWRDGRGSSEAAYRDSVGQDASEWNETFTAFHAWNYEQLQRIDMPNNDRANGTFRAVRTEKASVMKRNGLNPGDMDVVMNRGAAESFSMFTRIQVHGTEITVQNIPHHRVLGMYMQSGSASGFGDLFLGDGENEMVVLPQGIKFDYVRLQDWKDATPNYSGSASGTGSQWVGPNSFNPFATAQSPSATSAPPPPTIDPLVASKEFWLKNVNLAQVQKNWTLNEIKDDADVLGITPEDVKAYGKSSTKAAWIKALEAKKATL